MNKFQVFLVACILGACVVASAVMAAPPSIQPGSWTLALLPDTQYYTNHPNYNKYFYNQTQFLADCKTPLNIAYVLHEGDVTQDNYSNEWAIASKAFKTLDDANIHYSMVPGNHDYPGSGDPPNRTSLMADYFPVTRLASQPTFGGVYSGEPDSPHNSYSLFSSGDTDWLVLSLEYYPRDQIVDWADGVLKQYPNRQAMILTHAYLFRDDTRICNPPPYTTHLKNLPGGVNGGEEMWTQLKDNPNLQFVFCGHICGTGYLASEADHGNIVHQILADYQDIPHGGDGYLRLLEFLPDGQTVHVRTYSPYLDQSLTDADNDFVLTMTQVPEPSSLQLAAVGSVLMATGFVLRYRRSGVLRRAGVLRRWATRRSIRTNK